MNNLNKTLLASISVLVIACGGGGGGSDSPALNPIDNNRNVKPVLIDESSIIKPKIIDTYDPLDGTGTSMPVDDIFVANLNDSPEDEVVIAGRMSQFATPSSWQNYDMQIFGWNSGDLSNETNSWFSNNENQILGTEPSLRFGDFNSDGYKDMLVAHSTDMEYFGPSYVYFNSGNSSFQREDYDLGRMWIHDAVVADFDNDGVDDFFLGDFQGGPTLALSNNDNTFEFLSESNLRINSNSLAAGDFLNNGTTTILMLGSDNQALVSWSDLNGDLVLTKERDLPASRFYLSKWDEERAIAKYEPESIRAFNFDFNNDGVDDVVVINTMGDDQLFHKYTEVQFLENDGSGNFTDVTDSKIESFDTLKSGSYNPVLTDVNGDGLLDIMLSAKVYTTEPSTSVLIQSESGTFTEQFVDEFVQLNESINDVQDQTLADPLHSIVTGPENKKYIVSLVPVDNGSDSNKLNSLFLSEIGNEGTITVSTTVTALKSQWPWMTDAQANEILSLTSTNYINGMPVINYYDAMSPIGGVFLKANNGKIFDEIRGHISGVDFTGQTSALVKDSTNRTFNIDLSSSVFNTVTAWDSVTNIENQNQTNYIVQSSNLVGGESFSSHGITIQQDDTMKNHRLSLPSVSLNKNLFLTASFADLNFSPWLSMSGMWGNIERTNITEGTLSFKEDNWVANAGLMHATTNIESGLITSVNDIYALWGDFGWQHENNTFGVYAGFDPYIVSGSVTMALPESVDSKGNLIYHESTVPLISRESFYVRTVFTENLSDNISVNSSGILKNSGDISISVDVNWNF